jgi:hypothetical protein
MDTNEAGEPLGRSPASVAAVEEVPSGSHDLAQALYAVIVPAA